MVRLKSRYILFEIIYPDGLDKLPSRSYGQTHASLSAGIQLRQPSVKALDSRKIVKIIRDSIQANFGDYGAGATGSTLVVKYFSPTTSTGIVRVSRDHVRIVWAALSYVTQVMNRNAIIQVVRVSGTIKKCEQAAIARNKKILNTADLVEKGYSLNRFMCDSTAGAESDNAEKDMYEDEIDD